MNKEIKIPAFAFPNFAEVVTDEDANELITGIKEELLDSPDWAAAPAEVRVEFLRVCFTAMRGALKRELDHLSLDCIDCGRPVQDIPSCR